jgi:hypothetical protein
MSKKEKSKPGAAPEGAPSEKPLGAKSSRAKKAHPRRAGGGQTCTASKSSLPHAAAPVSAPATKAPLPKLKRHRQRMRLGEAMRKYGLDEQTIAQKYVGVVQVLSSRDEGEGIEKLLVDVLKECTRVLEPPAKPADRSGGDTLVQVQLVHNVPRPERKIPPSIPVATAVASADAPAIDLPAVDAARE